MKKLTAFLLIVVCIFSLAACGDVPSVDSEAPMPGSDPPSDDPLPAEEHIATAMPVTDAAILTSPPELTVLRENTEATALMGTHTWEYLNADGTTTAICADSLHPLQCRALMPTVVLMPSYDSHIDPNAGYLRFAVTPDTFSVRRWSEDDWEKTDASGTAVPVERANDGGAPLYILELADGNFIYEITARWEFNGSYGGTCSYSFCTEIPTLRGVNFS